MSDWVSIAGGSENTLSLENTVNKGLDPGEAYTFRYRAINQVGAGPWSESVEVLAAGVPAAPGKPTLVASDSTSVTLAFDQGAVDNGGSELLSYKLVRETNSTNQTHLISCLPSSSLLPVPAVVLPVVATV